MNTAQVQQQVLDEMLTGNENTEYLRTGASSMVTLISIQEGSSCDGL